MLTYSRQFVAGPNLQVQGSLTEAHRLGESLVAIRHPNLSAARSAERDVELLVFGQIVDPRNPDRSNSEVVAELLRRVNGFGDFETLSASLAGRWIAFLGIAGSWRVYPDACGTRTVYHASDPDGSFWAASQPNLLIGFAGAVHDPDIQKRFESPAHGADSWPLTQTPYKGVRQLIPNHYLDLANGEAFRFWPRHEIGTTGVSDAANTVEETLHGTIRALTLRGSAALPLTGGYDSRMLLACARGLRDRLSLVRVTGYHLPLYDALIPNKLARLIGQDIETIVSRKGSPEVVEAVASNTGGMYWGPADYMIYSFRDIRCDFLLLGQISEVTRCFYYPDGVHPQQVTAGLLARAANYGDNALATEELGEWLEGVPPAAHSFVLDLLYWEYRVGNWAANLANALDTFFEPVYPFNCRQLLVSMLGVPTTYRKDPHPLHRMVCSQAEPRFDRVAFNTSRIDRLIESHWRLKRAVQNYRKKASGF